MAPRDLDDFKTWSASLLFDAAQSGQLQEVLQSVHDEHSRSGAAARLAAATDSGQLRRSAEEVSLEAGAATRLVAAATSGALREAAEAVAAEGNAAERLAAAATSGALQRAAEQVGAEAKVAEQLAAAAHSGELLKAAKEVHEEIMHIDATRGRAARVLVDVLESGGLQGAVDAVHQARAADGAPARDIAEIKSLAARAILGGSQSGELQKALQLVTPQPRGGGPAASSSQASGARPLDAVRGDVLSLLCASAGDGSLDEILGAGPRAALGGGRRQQGQPCGQPAEDTRGRMSGTLLQSSEDGSLERHLADLHQESLDDARASMVGLLTRSAADGSLEKAVQSHRASQESIDDARASMVGLLTRSAADGSLEKAVQGSLPGPEPPPQNGGLPHEQIDHIQDEARGILCKAVVDGSLSDTLRSLKPETGFSDEVRAQVAGLLTRACQSGTLATALQSVQQADQEAAALKIQAVRRGKVVRDRQARERREPAPADTDEVRDRMMRTLEDALGDGRLEDLLLGPAGKDEAASGDATTLALAQLPPAGCTMLVPAAGAATMVPAMTALSALSDTDRRIGVLRATVRMAEERLLAHDAHIARLQEEIAAARCQSAFVAGEVESRQRALASQEELHWQRLQEKRKLVDRIDIEKMKQRHAAIDTEADFLSSRSTATTVCTMNDMPQRMPALMAKGSYSSRRIS